MRPNNSPWIKQLNRIRPIDRVTSSLMTDIAIVGGGIAGVTTAYFILKYTDKKVILIEGGKVAHGATGHNAGQMTSYFERQISNIAEEFGNELVKEAQADVDSGWNLLEEIYEDGKLTTPYYQFTGYAGLTDLDDILVHLKNNLILKDIPRLGEPLMIAEEAEVAKHIPKEYEGFYSFVPQKDILALLETNDTQYIAAISARKGVMNSALFTEELAGYLIAKHPQRFVLREESFVKEVVLNKDDACLKINEFVINARNVVLCTNGFEKFNITNNEGKDIDTEFHHLVNGTVGYMVGYLDERDKSPIAISYLLSNKNQSGKFDSEPYFYLTRRPFENEENIKHNLISVGGPDAPLEDTTTYSKDDHVYSEEAFSTLDSFLHSTVKDVPPYDLHYTYHWHGLMGYTPNGVRLIGSEPLNPVLLYNLGCNGVGILPSIYGGRRISRIIAGEKLTPSIFDPKLSENK